MKEKSSDDGKDGDGEEKKLNCIVHAHVDCRKMDQKSSTPGMANIVSVFGRVPMIEPFPFNDNALERAMPMIGNVCNDRRHKLCVCSKSCRVWARVRERAAQQNAHLCTPFIINLLHFVSFRFCFLYIFSSVSFSIVFSSMLNSAAAATATATCQLPLKREKYIFHIYWVLMNSWKITSI